MLARLLLLGLLVLAGAAPAEPASLRLAVWNLEMARAGPGVLLRDLLRGDPAAERAADRIAARAPDAILLLGFDWDHEGRALAAFQAMLAARGHPMPHAHAPRPNRGLATGLDLDGDGRLGRADDAQGWGRFLGEGGMAILSRHPLEPVRDLSDLLWRDLPGAELPHGLVPPEALAAQRLSTTGHWDVAMRLPGGGALRLLAWHATPPVFGLPGGVNRRRNADEARLWTRYLDGALGPAPEAPLVLLGDANLDPVDGDGAPEAIRVLLDDPRLQDPAPRGGGAGAPQEAADRAHRGDPALDTADWGGDPGPGNLRVAYALPSRDLRVLASGLDWPAPDRPEGASRHALVWLDVALPEAPPAPQAASEGSAPSKAPRGG